MGHNLDVTINISLKKFYEKVYRKGENKHFTNLVTTGKTSSEAEEVLRTTRWKSKKVLDVGCGTGLFAYLAAKKGAYVMGIDYSKQAIEIAKKNHQSKNLKYENLDVKNIYGNYDVIVSLGTLEHMDDPISTLKSLKNHLKPNGKIIITSPNWTNPRGYVLMTLFYLFNAPITLADLHYQTPIDFMRYAKKLNMNLKWRTIDKSWAHGEILLKDFVRRLPNVLKDAGLPTRHKNIKKFIKWIEENVIPFDNSLPHSGATGLYIFSRKKKKKVKTI